LDDVLVITDAVSQVKSPYPPYRR